MGKAYRFRCIIGIAPVDLKMDIVDLEKCTGNPSAGFPAASLDSLQEETEGMEGGGHGKNF
jgi:hypothetical protein